MISTNVLQASGLQIGPLLSTCVDACQRGCHEIRTVQAARISSGSLKVELKDSEDPRSALTEADAAAQRAIVGALRAEWGDELRIVGEEDEDEEFKAALANTDFKPLRRDMFDDDIGETMDIDPSEIVLFVDPLDGTREFVEDRLDSCQVLIGVAIGGEAVAGAIGIPFPAGDLSTESTIIYGFADVGSGVVGEILTRGPYPLVRNIDGVKYPRPHHATGDSTDEVMVACRKGAIKRFGGSNVIYGGAGNKILAAALGEVACSIQHKVGGPWDLCAPEAILKAMGGKMTDLFGEEIAIYKSDAPPRCNERGYLATPPGSARLFHESLAARMLGLPEVQKYRDEVENELK
jgi:3'-phosphoadenosine 5'-phosphosulfate (PAPS) 3'-phosphatase